MKKRILILLLLLLCCVSVFAQPKLAVTSYCDARLESCKVQDKALGLLEEKYPYDITVDYLYYFDTADPQSSLAQIALECANRQGMKQEYKTELQNNLDVLTLSALKQYAENVELMTANFTFCFDTQMTAWDVLSEVEQAEEDGVTAAPTVRFNHDLYAGSQTLTSLESMAKEYLSINEESSDNNIVEEVDSEITERCIDGGIDPDTGIAYRCSSIEETEEIPQEVESEQGQEELEQIEDPLFFRAIRQIRAWMLSVFQ